MDNGRQRALATWLKARLEPRFNEYSKDLQRTILQRPQDYVLSETVTDIERPSAQSVRLTVQARFDEPALEAALREGGFLRPWSGRREIMTYALRRTENGYSLATTAGAGLQGIVQQLAAQEIYTRGLTAATEARLRALGVQTAETTFARALSTGVDPAPQLVWLLGESGSPEAVGLLRPADLRSGQWPWQSWDPDAGREPILRLAEALTAVLTELDRPWENWLLLRSTLRGPDLLARASRLADVAVFDEVTPVQLTYRAPDSELLVRFYSVADTAQVEAQLRQRLRPASVEWSRSAHGRPLARLVLEP